VFTIAALAGIGVGVYFALKKDDSVAVHVTSLDATTAATASSKRGLKLTSFAPADAIASAGESAYAVLDELVLKVAYVRTAPNAGNGHDLASTDWGAYKALTLRPGTDTIPIDDKIRKMSAGPYFAADFVFWNQWSIKAFCKTATRFLYTTATGVVSLTEVPDTMPDDYAALEYDHMNGTDPFACKGGDDCVVAQSRMTFINSQYSYTVNSSSTVVLMVDANYVVGCYDGTLASAADLHTRHGSDAQLITPFGFDMSWGGGDNSSLRIDEPWNWTQPVRSGRRGA
jgi:hypothetical protein